MSTSRYELTEGQWLQIVDLFPAYRTGRPPKNSK